MKKPRKANRQNASIKKGWGPESHKGSSKEKSRQKKLSEKEGKEEER